MTKDERDTIIRQFVERVRESKGRHRLREGFPPRPLNQIGAAIERLGFESAMCLVRAKQRQARKDAERAAMRVLDDAVRWLCEREQRDHFEQEIAGYLIRHLNAVLAAPRREEHESAQ